MDYLYPIGGALIIIIIVLIVGQIIKQKQLNEILRKLEEIGEVKKVKKNSYDVILIVNKQRIYVKFLYVGKTKELSINSFRHWQIDSSSKKLNLLNTGGFERLIQPKILLVYPKPKKIVKYINENEVVFVKYDEQCFDFYLFTKDEIDKIGNFF